MLPTPLYTILTKTFQAILIVKDTASEIFLVKVVDSFYKYNITKPSIMGLAHNMESGGKCPLGT
jgi:hypothetical protein